MAPELLKTLVNIRPLCAVYMKHIHEDMHTSIHTYVQAYIQSYICSCFCTYGFKTYFTLTRKWFILRVCRPVAHIPASWTCSEISNWTGVTSLGSSSPFIGLDSLVTLWEFCAFIEFSFWFVLHAFVVFPFCHVDVCDMWYQKCMNNSSYECIGIRCILAHWCQSMVLHGKLQWAFV